MLLLEVAIIGDAGEAGVRVDVHRAVERRHDHFVLSRLRRGKGPRPIERQQLNRGCRGDADEIIRRRHVEMHLARGVLEAEVGIHALDLSRRKVAIAFVLDALAAPIHAPIAGLDAGLRRSLDASEGASVADNLTALIVEAILHVDDDGATQGIEAVDGIVAHHRHVVDGDLRQEVVVDDVAEQLVDAHAVLVDGKPLRHAVDRRGTSKPRNWMLVWN